MPSSCDWPQRYNSLLWVLASRPAASKSSETPFWAVIINCSWWFSCDTPDLYCQIVYGQYGHSLALPTQDRASGMKEDSRILSLDAPDLVGECLEPGVSPTECAALFLGRRSGLSLKISLTSRWRGTGGSSE